MSVPAAVERQVRSARANRCEVCGLRERQGRAGFSRELLELHHLQPAEKGGTSTAENLLLSCPTDHTLAQACADSGAWDRKAQIAFARRVRRAK